MASDPSKPLKHEREEAYAFHRGCGWSIIESGVRAQLNPRNGVASKYEAKPRVQARIAFWRRSDLTEEIRREKRQQLAARLEKAATIDRSSMFTDDGELKPLNEMTAEQRGLIETIEPTRNGPKPVMPSKLAADAQLARLYGLEAPAKVAPTNSEGDGPAELKITDDDRIKAFTNFCLKHGLMPTAPSGG